MSQTKTWDHFQAAAIENFADAVARLEFLFRQLLKRRRAADLWVLDIGTGNGCHERRCPERGLAEVARVQIPGAHLIGTVPFRQDLSANIVVCPDCGEAFHRWGHRRSFDKDDLRLALRRGCMRAVAIGPHSFTDHSKKLPFNCLRSGSAGSSAVSAAAMSTPTSVSLRRSRASRC